MEEDLKGYLDWITKAGIGFVSIKLSHYRVLSDDDSSFLRFE